MQGIGFNEHYGLQTAVFEGRKTMTRRKEPGFDLLTETNHRFEDGVVKFYFEGSYHPTIIKPRYHIGEVVAVRQAYKEFGDEFINSMFGKPGWSNKMFVAPSLMKKHIRFTDLKVERLQSISDEDCMKEGVIETTDGFTGEKVYTFLGSEINYMFATTAFATLIDKTSGKGTWERNQFMPAYTFELID